MKINNNLNIKNTKISFKNNLNPLSKALYTLSNNDMLNASFVDLFFMDTPRTIVEFKNRGKQAGIEMGFREYTGTFIAEFSAALFATITSKIVSKIHKPKTKINSSSWITNKGLDVFREIYEDSNKTPKSYVESIFNSMSGLNKDKTYRFSDLISADSASEAKKANEIIEKVTNLITDNKISKKQTQIELNKIQDSIINILKADNNITLKSKNNEITSNLTHILRDITDSGRNIFFKGEDLKTNSNEIISKLKTLNKSRIAAAIPLSMLLAITNQYINRKLTKKRTGIDNFVGENGYEKNVNEKNQTQKQKGLLLKKILSAGVFLLMLSKVMGIKKPSDFINKLEFNGPVTGGNAIKTIYGTLILGRIFASKDSTELRETNTRDYLGFLNWLVFGGFVAKGAAQFLDPEKKYLFNIQNAQNANNKGFFKNISHWLNNVSLKSQKEIIAQRTNVKQNLKNLNIAQIAGIAYSGIMLGVVLPKFNIWMTKRNKKNNDIKNNEKISSMLNFQSVKMKDFMINTKKPNIKTSLKTRFRI